MHYHRSDHNSIVLSILENQAIPVDSRIPPKSSLRLLPPPPPNPLPPPLPPPRPLLSPPSAAIFSLCAANLLAISSSSGGTSLKRKKNTHGELTAECGDMCAVSWSMLALWYSTHNMEFNEKFTYQHASMPLNQTENKHFVCSLSGSQCDRSICIHWDQLGKSGTRIQYHGFPSSLLGIVYVQNIIIKIPKHQKFTIIR